MKNIFLSVVVVTTLVAAGLGGTFAHFSDTEKSEGNYLETGSLDLKVNGHDDMPWDVLGTGVGPKITVTCLEPCKSRDYTIELYNAGECETAPDLYMHIKNLDCYPVEPKLPIWVIYDEATGEVEIVDADTAGAVPKTEPELVAECGGWLGEDADGNQIWVPGIGFNYGENCELAKHITVSVMYPWDPVTHTGTLLESKKIYDWECQQTFLFPLPPCNEEVIGIIIHMQQHDEAWYVTEGLLDRAYFTPDHPKSWSHWPTNALQADGVSFDIMFELVGKDPPPPEL